MFRTVEEGFDFYRQALLVYLEKLEGLKKKYGDEEFMSWNDADYAYATAENKRLEAMEQVLGLNQAEKDAVMEEAKARLAAKK